MTLQQDQKVQLIAAALIARAGGSVIITREEVARLLGKHLDIPKVAPDGSQFVTLVSDPLGEIGA